jgi:hypothetical protein
MLPSITADIALYYEQECQPTIIYNYCHDAIRQGRNTFIFVCPDEGASKIAYDILNSNLRHE